MPLSGVSVIPNQDASPLPGIDTAPCVPVVCRYPAGPPFIGGGSSLALTEFNPLATVIEAMSKQLSTLMLDNALRGDLALLYLEEAAR